MVFLHSPFIPSNPFSPYSVASLCPTLSYCINPIKQISCCYVNHSLEHISDKVPSDEKAIRRRMLLSFITASSFPTLISYAKTKSRNPYDERRLLEQNKRIQRENQVPEDFPNFVREGFEVKVVTPENYVKRDSGLIYKDFEVGKGDCPKAGQQVIFHYIGYNESGRRIDSTYLQGAPAKIRFGTNGLVPGFEEGIRDMRPGGKRRIIIPPELGPPVSSLIFAFSYAFHSWSVLSSLESRKDRYAPIFVHFHQMEAIVRSGFNNYPRQVFR